jgi:SAM-dependent methyltransferase
MQMKSLLKQFIRHKSKLTARKYESTFLPLKRSNHGLADDGEYVRSAIKQVEDLSQFHPLTSSTRLLDFGCGQGRFANGLLLKSSDIGSYCGGDTCAESIAWGKRWLQRYNPNFTFIHLPAYNARYNSSVNARPSLPFSENSYDVAFLNSVFSHMLVDDVKFYLSQLHKVLGKNGILYATAYVEENVPYVEENPEGYLDDYLGTSRGALHKVRYEKSFFLDLFEKAGFTIVSFQYRKIEHSKQSVTIAKKK